jgi:hypothetical protein
VFAIEEPLGRISDRKICRASRRMRHEGSENLHCDHALMPSGELSREWVTSPDVQRLAAHSTMPFICPIQNASLACSDLRSDGMRFSLTALP